MSDFKPVYGKTVRLSESSVPWYTDAAADTYTDAAADTDKLDTYNEDKSVINKLDPKLDEVTVKIRYVKRICKQALFVLLLIVVVVVGYNMYNRHKYLEYD